jgi:16S rRNA (cytidine1402-2'-O)-methyltransferase
VLTLVSVPIGPVEDITLRAIKEIKSADVVIGEESKPLFQLLKALEIPRPPQVEFLNEHSKDVDLEFFVQLCSDKKVVLVTDCGTPGFCDPGAELVRLCRKKNIPVTAAPGASSLMVLLSLSGVDLKEFYFRGFLPAKNELRQQELAKLKTMKIPIVMMDTPYRFQAFLKDLQTALPDHLVVLGMDLTQSSERVYSGPLKKMKLEELPEKSEFILLVYPTEKQ